MEERIGVISAAAKLKSKVVLATNYNSTISLYNHCSRLSCHVCLGGWEAVGRIIRITQHTVPQAVRRAERVPEYY